ncbi:MAG: transposase [Phycisphaerales bacterium]|nr:transposase [Phycisphaerales bacterium]
MDNVSFDKLFIFDNTNIRLFSDVMKGVGRNPKNEGKKKGGLKVQMLIDAHASAPVFVCVSEAKSHDKNFTKHFSLPAHSMIVFDRAYIAQLLLMVLKAKSKTQKAFSTVAALVRIHLISNLELLWMLENCRRTYTKRQKTSNKSPAITTEIF